MTTRAALRGLARRVDARLRPFRFDPHPCRLAPLDGAAERVESLAALSGIRREAAFVEIAPQSGLGLDPLFLLGEQGTAHPFPTAPCIVPPLRIYRLTGETRIFGKGLFWRDGTILTLDPVAFHELGRLDYPIHRLSLIVEGDRATAKMPRGVKRVEGPCLYLAQGGEGVWGHWLVDILPRLAMALAVPAATRIVLDADRPAWAMAMLRRFGIEGSRIVWHDKFRDTLVADDLYLPSFLRLGPGFSPACNLAWGLVAPPRPAGGPQRIYVSRSRLAAGSTIANAPAIEAAATARGYPVVHPERMSLAAQMALFAGARIVVGEYGSALHNTVFGAAATQVAVLQSRDHPHFVQSGIGAVRGQLTGCVFGPSADGERRFTLPPELFAEALDLLEG